MITPEIKNEATIIVSAVEHIIHNYNVDDILPYLEMIRDSGMRLGFPKVPVETLLKINEPSKDPNPIDLTSFF